MAHVRQSSPDAGLGFHAQVLQPLQGVPSSLDSDNNVGAWRLCTQSLNRVSKENGINLFLAMKFTTQYVSS